MGIRTPDLRITSYFRRLVALLVKGLKSPGLHLYQVIGGQANPPLPDGPHKFPTRKQGNDKSLFNR